MPTDPRKRIFIDPKVQGILLTRIFMYWLLSVLTTGAVLLSLNVAQGPTNQSLDPFQWQPIWQQYSAILVASVLVLPILLVDTVLLSSRFVGPVMRVRRLMRALVAGEKVDGMDLRGKDFWPDMARDFNALLVYVKMLKIQSERACHAAPLEGEVEPASWETAR